MIRKKTSKTWRSADPQDPLFSADSSPFFHLARLVGLYQLRMDTHLKRVGMDMSRWRVLAILHEEECAPMSRIAELAVFRISTTTKLIYRMENEGLTSTSVSEQDGRVTEVRLTSKGREAFEGVRSVASLIFERAFHDCNDDEIQTLLKICRKLYNNLY
ncbi:MarR family winged helix-turn-helix transcriptional regulator [Acetobacter thailandicus]|uniref:MarR family transcriptional regulator n=1 Tax=Acetobacter thailandicus TaxID=1502842 RepID=A0ABT3QBC2_9PROT|nr:MarR family transcriptional regulator [Acetobacter thailandicus]MCX2562592.1 MarR family transcriptional regulator [Acetobacter thailandicus]